MIDEHVLEKLKKLKRLRKEKKKKRYSQQQQREAISQSKALSYQKFVNLMNPTKFENLKSKIINFYQQNFPINYLPKYNFSQQWENTKKSQQYNSFDLLQGEHETFYIASFIIMLANVICLWIISIERFFAPDSSSFKQIYGLAILSQILDGVIRFVLKFIRKGNIIDPYVFVKTHAKDIIALIYFSIKITPLIQENVAFYMFEILVVFLLYKRAEQIYQCFRITQFALKYEYQFKIFDLLTNLLVMIHICVNSFFIQAIAVYQASKVNPDTNWVITQRLAGSYYLRIYLKSFYFACTTILTIGYGDITPISDPQVVTIIFIQIAGVIVLGYLINEIGQMLSSIRKKRENLEKDLSAIGKLSKYYNLQTELANRAKSYIISKTDIVDYLTPDEENQVLMKLNDELRTEITYEDSLNIVKSSIFFMCRWSKSMQHTVAQRLTKILFSPNERLFQHRGKQRIYVIRKGKINVFMDRFTNHSRSEFRKLLKIIDIDESKDICDNVYGYTAVISNRNVRMDAIAKEFTLAYSLSKDDFLHCLHQREQDYQYYHQIKLKIDSSRICQMWQTPSICSTREHYNPSRTLVIRKILYHSSKLKNTRIFYIRNTKTRFINYRGCEQKNAVERMKYRIGTTDFYSIGMDQRSLYEAQQSTEELSVKQNNERPKILKKMFMSKKKDVVYQQGEEEFQYQEISKEYKNFFKKHNIQTILYQYEVQNCAQPPKTAKVTPKKKQLKLKAKTEFSPVIEEKQQI